MAAKHPIAELEAIRRAALLYLAERPSLPMALSAIHQQLASDGHRLSPDDLAAELDVLKDEGWIKAIRPAASYTLRYKAEPKLITAHRANEL